MAALGLDLTLEAFATQIVGSLVQSLLSFFLFCFSRYSSEEEFFKVTEKVKRGDIVGVRGKPGK